MTVRMIHANAYQGFQTSRASYTSDANGIVAAVALGDILDMINSGCELVAAPGVESVGLWSNAGAPSNGTSGTLAGAASPGDLLVDTTNKTLYQNTNTLLSPTWTLKASSAGGALSGTFNGAIGGVTPAAGVFTTLQSTGAATLATVDGILGSVTPAAATVTTLQSTGAATLATVNGILGNVTPAAATVTTLNATGLATLTSAVLSGYFEGSVGNALTAVGTNRASALQLAAQFNNITTAAAGTGVILPVGVIGMEIDNFNAGANSIKVYASGSETIDTVAGSTGVPLASAKRCRYKMVAANTWVSAQWGLPSA